MSDQGEGTVIRVHARKCRIVADEDGEELVCAFRGRLFEDLKGHTKPVAVGDRVVYRVTKDGAAVEGLLPRRNALSRPAKRHREEIQTIAANIDRVIVVAAVKDPPLRRGLIDRFLVAAEREELDVLICLNKMDLLENDDEREEVTETAALYRSLEYPLIETSAVDGRGVDELRSHLERGISIIAGHSGVGKSTLINRVDPNHALQTGSVSERHGKGRHTTTSVSLLLLSCGGFIVDTPGIRAFGIDRMRAADLGHFFPEMAKRLPDCQFPDCTHLHEPGCAVREAFEAGEIHESRFKSYQSIMEELEK